MTTRLCRSITLRFWPSNGREALTNVYKITPRLCRSITLRFWPSNGREALTNVYKITPRLCRSITLRFWPSNGREPLTNVYKMTPRLQTSTSGPSYFFPAHAHYTYVIMTKTHKHRSHWLVWVSAMRQLALAWISGDLVPFAKMNFYFFHFFQPTARRTFLSCQWNNKLTVN